MQQLGQPMIGLRPDHDVDERRALEHLRALGLGDAAGDADHHARRRPRAGAARSCRSRPSSE